MSRRAGQQQVVVAERSAHGQALGLVRALHRFEHREFAGGHRQVDWSADGAV